MQKAPTPEAKPRRLNSWKEIAAYLGRGVRTVQRWEKMGLPVQRPKSDSRGSVTAATDEIDNCLSGAHTHGFNAAQIGERQLFREGLLDSVQQARALRKEMAILREDGQTALTQLTDKITTLGKSCGNTLSESNPKNFRVLEGAEILSCSPAGEVSGNGSLWLEEHCTVPWLRGAYRTTMAA